MSPQLTWMTPLLDLIADRGGRGLFFAGLPAYRPDLLQSLAAEAGFAFADFRSACMSRSGWAAGQLPLSALTDFIADHVEGTGLVVHNAEALLATKPAGERRQWMAASAGGDWPVPVVVPVCLFLSELPDLPQWSWRFAADNLPAESLLLRLAAR